MASFLPPLAAASRLILGGVLVLACILNFTPLYPVLPSAGLDPSWIVAMNQAVAQGSVFGRDIIFTFGPYSALYTQAYHPATYSWTLVLGLFLSLSYAAMLMMQLRQRGNGWLWLYAVFLFLVDSRDALFFSYPLLVVLTASKATLQDKNLRRLVFSRRAQTVYAFSIALLGVLPIIKGSFLPLSFIAALTVFIMYWQKGERALAYLLIMLPLMTMIVFWHIAGQPLAALPNYFHFMFQLISGFAEAMSVFPGNTRVEVKIASIGMITAYILAAVLILASILRSKNDPILHKIAITSCVGLFLFIAFKAGFVRHDGHALAAGSALVLAALALSLFGVTRIPTLTLIFTITTWALIHGAYLRTTSLHSSQLTSLCGVLSGDRMGGRLQAAFNQKMYNIHAESSIPMLDGTTDVYPHDQAALIASGNNWDSRPIPQSYSAYTPDLAKLNEAHLRGSHAPDNIIFRVDTEDSRFPSIEDGLSWPTLISHYSISGTDKNYAYLKKRLVPFETKKTAVLQGGYKLGKLIDLPQGDHIFFAEFNVEPTFLGRIATIVIKPPPLFISVTLANGHSKTYRFIPSMARTGFILSPLIESTTDFVQLADGQLQSFKQSMVNRLRIAPSAGYESIFWSRDYSLKIFILEINPKLTLHTHSTLGTLLPYLPK
jgi:hypothetical protein